MKCLSNSQKVLDAIPESEGEPSVINHGPNDVLPYDCALGVNWNVNEDLIYFNVKLAEKKLFQDAEFCQLQVPYLTPLDT